MAYATPVCGTLLNSTIRRYHFPEFYFGQVCNINYYWYFNVAWEQDASSTASSIQYTYFNVAATNNFVVTQYPVGRISNASYQMNYKPSIVADAGAYARVAWITNHHGYPGQPWDVLVVYWDENDTGKYTNLDYNVQSVSLNKSDDWHYYFAWSRLSSGGQWANYCSKDTTGTIKTLSTSGQAIQLSNGPAKSGMFASSFYNTTALPYAFQTSADLAMLPKTASESAWYQGRGATLEKGDIKFDYAIEGLQVDGRMIPFTAIPSNPAPVTTNGGRVSPLRLDSLGFGSLEKVNGVLLTEPFTIGSNSIVTMKDYAGFLDSAAAAIALAPGGFIGYKVEFLDAAGGTVLATVKSSTLTTSNAPGYSRNIYSIDTKAIAGTTLRARIAISTNLVNPKTAIVDSYLPFFTDESMQKKSLIAVSATPTDFAMEQNYPNPFNPSTEFRFSLPEASAVSLIVFDVLGREVATLVRGNLQSGYHTATWNASTVASGVYFARFIVTDELGRMKYNKVNKLLLVK